MALNFKDFISQILGADPPKSLDEQEVQIACAALLIHCAKADGTLTQDEDQNLRSILRDRYGLEQEETETLVALAQEREQDATDIQRFTWVLHESLDREGRLEFIRSLWEVTNSDGVIDHDERSIVRLIASLMRVEMKDAIAIRRDISGR